MYKGYLAETISNLDRYLGKTMSELFSDFSIVSISKSKLQNLCLAMMGLEGKDTILSTSGIILKTIRLKDNGRVQESMSFPTFRFEQLINESWDKSSFKNYLQNHLFLFIVFKENGYNYVFHKYFIWKAEPSLIDGPFFETWQETKRILEEGDIVKEVKCDKSGKAKIITNFPGLSFNGVCHVRPHAQNANDVYALPIPDKKTGLSSFTKQCFWINNTFISKLIACNETKI